MESQKTSFMSNFKWNAQSKWGNKFKIEASKVTLNKPDSYGIISLEAIPQNQPIQITFTLINSKGSYPLWFGIVSSIHKQDKSIQFGQDVLYFYTQSGKRSQGFVQLNGKVSGKSSQLALLQGDKITMNIDLSKKQVKWRKNGVDFGTTEYPVKTDKQFYIFVQMWTNNQSIQVS